MKVVWKSIPENSSLDKLERKIDLENRLIDTGDLEPGEIPTRDEKTLKDVLIGTDEETLKYKQELKEKLKKNPMTKDQAESTVNWAFRGNQQCYSLAERDSGYSIRELISIANGDVEVSDEDMEVMSSRPVAKAYSVILKTVSIRRRDYILSFFFRKKSLPLPAF